MSEKLRTRVSRLIAGSINAIIDGAEDKAPKLVLQQMIREIESAIEESRINCGKIQASRYTINKRLQQLNQQHQTLADNIEVALSSQRDDLAKSAIAKQLDIEAQIPLLEQDLLDQANQGKEVEQYFQALKAKKREYEQELKLLQNQATAQINLIDGIDNSADRLLNKSRIAIDDNEVKLAELEQVSLNHRIDERLSQIKNQREVT